MQRIWSFKAFGTEYDEQRWKIIGIGVYKRLKDILKITMKNLYGKSLFRRIVVWCRKVFQ
jgi:hypothetical protein